MGLQVGLYVSRETRARQRRHSHGVQAVTTSIAGSCKHGSSDMKNFAEHVSSILFGDTMAKRQFVCLHKYYNSVLRSIGRHLEASDHRSLPHVPDVQWSEDIPICCFCSVMLTFIQPPDKIHRTCIHATLQPKELLEIKLNSCQKIIDDLASIIARL